MAEFFKNARVKGPAAKIGDGPDKSGHSPRRKKENAKIAPITAHLKELRRTIIWSLLAIIAGSVVCYGFFRVPLMEIVTGPLSSLSRRIPIVYISVAESFTTEMKVGIIAGIIISSPVVIFFIWRFVGPALFPKEKKALMLYIPIAIALFCCGVCFCYFIIFPFTLQFFLSAASVDMEAMLTISDYVDFLCKILVPFGLVFETPLVVNFLVRFHIVSVVKLKRARKYVLLGCAILGAIITPPDVISQLSVLGPMYLMYEIGMLVGQIAEKRSTAKTAKDLP